MKLQEKQLCCVCGYEGKGFKQEKVINQDLFKKWKLSQDLKNKFDLRESCNCPNCGNSTRTRALAAAILKTKPLKGTKTLKDWVQKANKTDINIAEINTCGKLHPILNLAKHLRYSEYVIDGNWRIKFVNKLKGVAYQDIENLNYKNHTFDLVLHSEVLEHVNNPEKALKECLRVLKDGGVCLFTVPLIMSRLTKRRTKKVGDKIIYLEEPSFHGSGEKDNLVYWEFGKDVIKKWKAKVAFKEPNKELFVLAVTKN